MANKQPIYFSICIPNFNYAKFIGKTIESVLKQTYQKFEIIIVDNCSTDNSEEVVRSYMKKDKRIKFFKNKQNLGFPRNCNRAVEESRGNYYILLSADDVMLPNALEKYAGIIQNFPDDAGNIFLSSQAYFIDENDQPMGINVLKEICIKEQRKGFIILDIKQILQKNMENVDCERVGGLLTHCQSRKLFDDINGYDPSFQVTPDIDFFQRLLDRQPLCIYVPEPLFAYRVHRQSTSNWGERTKFALIDKYRLVQSFSQDKIDRYQVNEGRMLKNFIRNTCMGGGLIQLLRNDYFSAVQYYFFSFVTYPKVALKMPRTYMFALLLLTGPLAPALTKLAFSLKKSKYDPLKGTMLPLEKVDKTVTN